jgi:hypothetical protein
MTSQFNPFLQGTVPISTIIPTNEDLFVPYFTRTYEDLATAINNKDNIYFQIPIKSTAANIPNLPNFGAFIVCVSGSDSTLPTITASLCKSSSSVAGSVAQLGFQAGTATWAGKVLTITSTASSFQIAHNNTGVTGNFNIKIIGTQGAT